MCGLISVLSKRGKPAGQYAFELYKKQASRGKDGYGYIAIHDNQIVSLERSKDEETIRTKLMRERAEMILFHHRFPTSTDNTVGTTHPMYVSNDELEYDYYFAHNGVITNASELKAQHNNLGYNYITEHKIMEVAEYAHGLDPEVIGTPKIKFNDSESLAIELARYIEGKTEQIETVGAAAFWGVSVVKGTNQVHRVYYGKNKGRDLSFFKNKKWFGVTSITGDDLEDMKLFTLDLATRNIENSDLAIDEAKPVTQTTMGYSAYHNSVHNSYEILENKLYTPEEARRTGYAMTFFTATWNNGIMYYVPSKFADVRSPAAYSHSLPELPTPSTDAKAKERLEELAGEYARYANRRDVLEENFVNGIVDREDYHVDIREIEMKISALEESMSNLGIDQSTVDETVELAIQLYDYDPSYYTVIR